MKYLKLFETEALYDAFKEGDEYLLPNVSYIVETNSCEFQPYVEPPKEYYVLVTYVTTSPNETAKIFDGTVASIVDYEGNEVTKSLSCYYITYPTAGEHIVRINFDSPILSKGLSTNPFVKTVVVSDDMTELKKSCFEYCSSLTDLVLGKGITTIGYYLCDGDNQLKTITCRATIAPTIDIQRTFTECGALYGTLYYPSGSNYSSWIRPQNFLFGTRYWSSSTFTE